MESNKQMNFIPQLMFKLILIKTHYKYYITINKFLIFLFTKIILRYIMAEYRKTIITYPL